MGTCDKIPNSELGSGLLYYIGSERDFVSPFSVSEREVNPTF